MSLINKIKNYWNLHPAGENEVLSLQSDRLAFFDERDRQTKLLYPNLDNDYDFAKSNGKVTLELGCGMGYNAQRIAQNGASLVVVDMAERAINLTKERFNLRNLNADFVVANCECLPFSSEVIEIVYSSGVIHHTSDTEQAAREIMRVLKSNGWASIMVYNRNSRWFWWNIVVVLGFLMFFINIVPKSLQRRIIKFNIAWKDFILDDHERLSFDNVLRAGTDFGGLRNPVSRVYTRRSVKRLFSEMVDFSYITQFNQYKAMIMEPSFVVRLIRELLSKIDRKWGWFLIMHARKK